MEVPPGYGHINRHPRMSGSKFLSNHSPLASGVPKEKPWFFRIADITIHLHVTCVSAV